VLYLIASGKAGFDLAAGFASNGYGEHSPGGYSLVSALIAEVVLTAFFLIVILGATDGRAPAGFAPLAIGLALALIHLISIPVTNTSVNPARSTGPALFVGGWALSQLWLFWVAPLAGAAIGGGRLPRPREKSGRLTARPDGPCRPATAVPTYVLRRGAPASLPQPRSPPPCGRRTPTTPVRANMQRPCIGSLRPVGHKCGRSLYNHNGNRQSRGQDPDGFTHVAKPSADPGNSDRQTPPPA
jgi:hypothetical protein